MLETIPHSPYRCAHINIKGAHTVQTRARRRRPRDGYPGLVTGGVARTFP